MIKMIRVDYAMYGQAARSRGAGTGHSENRGNHQDIQGQSHHQDEGTIVLTMTMSVAERHVQILINSRAPFPKRRTRNSRRSWSASRGKTPRSAATKRTRTIRRRAPRKRRATTSNRDMTVHFIGRAAISNKRNTIQNLHRRFFHKIELKTGIYFLEN